MGSHEEDLPASQLTPETSARIPKPDGDEERSLDPDAAQRMTEHNYDLGRRYYSHTVLRKLLAALIEQGLDQGF